MNEQVVDTCRYGSIQQPVKYSLGKDLTLSKNTIVLQIRPSMSL